VLLECSAGDREEHFTVGVVVVDGKTVVSLRADVVDRLRGEWTRRTWHDVHGTGAIEQHKRCARIVALSLRCQAP
jgi:hypothetical protein